MPKFEHINDCEEALRACKNIDEVHDLLDNFPRKFGDWWVDTIPVKDGKSYYEVTNEWWDYETEELRVATYELEIEVEDED